ncbi:Tubulin-specific chaperone C [Hondaea fermentalgiana]|uniref:Tubulin-specific chaperone C n=1 Tax=Hondaea fermentalgiana TaxID=2315210 RepID=A0A2R5GFE5_9STRA|nr:Tubulin-specific chaperone C [Hondaea fermentalgiana]|eukprot:GBG27353.1 Tubulin-specific chaperone C [Hondaea fermentalgiana]
MGSEGARVSGLAGKSVVLGVGEVSGGALTLCELSNCEIVVLDYAGQVTAERLVNCRVFVAACAGSCMLRGCRGSVFTMATKQCRVLDSHDCTLFLDIQGDPVIEKSSAMYFGAHNASHPVLASLYKRGGIHIDGEGSWSSVFDFSADEAKGGQRNWNTIEAGQPLIDVRTGGLSPLGVYKLRLVFWRFDTDRDGGLSFSEVNSFQNAIGSDEVLQDAASMRDNFAKVGLGLDHRGHLPFASFLELYQLQGEDDLLTDLAKLGMERLDVTPFDLEPYALDFFDGDDEEEEEEEEDYDDDAFDVDNGTMEDSLRHFGNLLAAKPGGADAEFDLDLAFEGDANDLEAGAKLGEQGTSAVPTRRPPPLPRSFVSSQEEESEERALGDEEIVEKKQKKAKKKKKGERKSKSSFPVSEAMRGPSRVQVVEFDTNETYGDDRFEEERDEEEGGGEHGQVYVEHEEELEDWDVLRCASNLCIEAHHRGVDLQKWFANYDVEKRTSLHHSVFETAFSALLLGLCAGSSEAFVSDVERLLDPHNLHELCALLVDHRDAAFVRYMPLVLKSKARSPRRGGDAAEASFLSHPLFAEVGGSVESFLRERFRAEGERVQHGSQTVFERIRDAIQAWKWSVGGRLPTQQGISVWSAQRECISERNLRNAFRASLQVDFRPAQLRVFGEMIRTSVESDVEAHARAAQEAEQEEASNAGQQVTIAALLRWLGTLRLSRAIGREAWLHSKRAGARQADQGNMELLERALAGDSEAMQTLERAPELLERLLSQRQIVPHEAIPGEARGRAQDWVQSPEGQAAVRKRALRVKMAEAQAAVLEEATAREMQALESDVGPRVALFLEYCRACFQGTASGSFDGWIAQREESRAKKRRALHRWERAKKQEQQFVQADGDYVIVASALFDKVRGLVGRTFDHQRDATRGYSVCRSSRYAGLDADKTIAAFVKRKTEALVAEAGARGVEALSRATATASAGDVLVSYDEFREAFGPLLNSLTADPRTRDEALLLLSPSAAAQDRTEEYLLSKRGKEDMEGAKDKSQVRQALKRKYEEEILRASGFQPRSEAKNQLEAARDERRARADANFRQWARNKAKAKRRAAKEAKAKIAEEEALQKERRAKSRRAYRQWKTAASQGKYPAYAPAASGPGDDEVQEDVAMTVPTARTGPGLTM